MTKSRSTRVVRIGSASFGGDGSLSLIAGPCVIESEALCLTVARTLQKLTKSLGMGFVFKASYDKANRSSVKGYRGLGRQEGLRILRLVRQRVGCAVLTDVHAPDEVAEAADSVDALQVPAFLCRQTDLLMECGRSGKPVNIKKGQFLSPWDMVKAVEKIEKTGNRQILLTERGTSFGYHNLVVDMRGLAVMRETGCPVIFDATHSVQLPGARGDSSGGQREFIFPLTRSAAANGISGLFCETHPRPEKALSDGPNTLPLSVMKRYLQMALQFHRAAKPWVNLHV